MSCTGADQTWLAPATINLSNNNIVASQSWADQQLQYFFTIIPDCATLYAAVKAQTQAQNFPNLAEENITINQPSWTDLVVINAPPGPSPTYSISMTISVTFVYGGPSSTITFGYNVVTGTVTETTTTTGSAIPWPLTLGGNCENISLSQPTGTNGVQVSWPGAPLASFLNTINFDKWWCCASAPQGCCTPAGPPPPQFLIPRPASPTPVQQNSSIPPLQQMIFLSNYTFQFVNDFGRVTPQ